MRGRSGRVVVFKEGGIGNQADFAGFGDFVGQDAEHFQRPVGDFGKGRRSDETAVVVAAFRVIDDDHHGDARLVCRGVAGEDGAIVFFGIATALAHFVRGAGFAGDGVAFGVGASPGAAVADHRFQHFLHRFGGFFAHDARALRRFFDFEQRQRHGDAVVGNGGVGVRQLQRAAADAVAEKGGGVVEGADFFGVRQVAALFGGEADAGWLAEAEVGHEFAVFFARHALANHRHADV